MKRILSGVQPTGGGGLHLGNYLGAIKGFARTPEGYDALYCVVDLHAITVKQDPVELRSNTRAVAAAYLAAGVDPNSIFVQSMVPAHAQLGWILQCVARVGWMDRMTQFREKTSAADISEDVLTRLADYDGSELPAVGDIEAILDHLTERRSHREKASVGLYTYPVLQAADILLYQADRVPVGDDQAQHIYLAGDIAQKFNHDFGETFVVPKPHFQAVGRIMDLKSGTSKMSKSVGDDSSRINLLDTDDEITKKIKRATADTRPIPETVEELADMPAVRNLVGIMAAIQDRKVEEVLGEFVGQGYGKFKPALVDVLVSHLGPIRDEMRRLLADEVYIDERLVSGFLKADGIASKTLIEAKDKIGFLNAWETQ